MKNNIHFIGIGGIGMSGLARYFLAQGFSVSGSDSSRSDLTNALVAEGIKVMIGHKASALPRQTMFVIYNRAIKSDNPEIGAAEKYKIPTIPYAAVLGDVTKRYETIAITGSHGKSTTTALTGLALIKAGFDPTIFVGTNLRELGGKNIRIGESPFLVLEADDFGAAFLEYSPTISIVTNIDREHMDFYKNFANVKKAFLGFMANTRQGGALILNRDDSNLHSLRSSIASIAKKGKFKVIWYTAKSPYSPRLRSILKIPGEHNLSNAMAVYELGKLLKIPEKKTLTALGSYSGAWRRFEYRGKLQLSPGRSRPTALVYDDYAHHPTEIRATLQGFRAKFPNSPLICIFQPHQAKRLELLFKDFRDAFTDADALILLPSYTVAGRDLVKQNYTSEKLTQAIKKKYPKKEVYYLADPKKLKSFLKKNLLHSTYYIPPTVLIMMGAGDIVNYTDSLIDSSS